MKRKMLLIAVLACVLSLLLNISQVRMRTEKDNTSISEEIAPCSYPPGKDQF